MTWDKIHFSVLCMSPGATRTSQNYLWNLAKVFCSSLRNVPWIVIFLSLSPHLSHVTSYFITWHTICSIFHWPFSSPQFRRHKICHLVKKLEGYGPIRGAAARQRFPPLGHLLKSATLDARAWYDWCRQRSPGVMVTATSVTAAAGFPLHYPRELWMAETAGLQTNLKKKNGKICSEIACSLLCENSSSYIAVFKINRNPSRLSFLSSSARPLVFFEMNFAWKSKLQPQQLPRFPQRDFSQFTKQLSTVTRRSKDP